MLRTAVALSCFAMSALSLGAADVPALLAAYKADRAAVNAAPEVLAAADALIKKAEAAKSPEVAVKLIREARWRLPYRPKNMPANVAAVLGGTRLRHADRVNAIAYGKDGQSIASGSRDGTVRLWDLSSGGERWVYAGLAAIKPPADAKVQDDVLKVASVAVSPDGTLVAAAGYNEIHLLKSTDGTLVKAIKAHKGQIKGIAFSGDGTQLASVGDDKQLAVWTVATGDSFLWHDLNQLGSGSNPVGRFESIAWSPKLKHVALTNADGKLIVFDVSAKPVKMKLAATIVQTSTSVYCCKFMPDGTGILTGSEEQTPPRLTAAPAADAPVGQPNPGVMPAVRQFNGIKRRTTALDISPDGQLLITGGEDAVVRVWDVNSGKALKQFSAHTTEVLAVAVRPDGKEVATADDAGIIRLWPLAANDENARSGETTGTAWCVAASPNGQKLAYAGADRVVRVVDAGTGDPIKEFTGHTAAVGTVTFLDDDTVASAGGDRVVHVWSLKQDGSPKKFAGHQSVILALAAGEQGRVLYSGSIDRTLKKWDVASGKLLATWDAKSAVCAIAAIGNRAIYGTADGWLVTIQPKGNGVEIVAQTGAHTAGVAAVAADANGGQLASVGGDGVLRRWAIGTNGALTGKATVDPAMNVSANVPYPLSAVAFSPDGKSIAYAGQEGLLRLYDPVGVRETRSLRGHADWVSGVAFAEGGKLVAGAGTDGGLRRFPLAQDTVAAIPGHVRAASCVAISPDGTRAVTIGPDEWKHWDLKTGRELGTFTAPSYKATTALFTSPDEFVVGGDSEKLNWYSTKTGQRVKGEAVGGQQIYSLASNGRDMGIWQLRIDNSEFLTIRAGKLSDGYKLPGDKQEAKKVFCATITADATLGLAAQADKMVQVVDLVERKLKGELWPLFDSGPVDLAMVPDGSKVVAIDDAGSIKVATVADRKVTATAKAHADGCNGILVAKSGDRFATLGADGTIKAWDMAAKELRSWKMPMDVKAAAIAPDGRTIVTANADGSATVLPVP